MTALYHVAHARSNEAVRGSGPAEISHSQRVRAHDAFCLRAHPDACLSWGTVMLMVFLLVWNSLALWLFAFDWYASAAQNLPKRRSWHCSCGCCWTGGANVGPLTESQWTPLHAASYGGHAEVAQRLLVAGADPAIDDCGWLALHIAALHGHHCVVDVRRRRRRRRRPSPPPPPLLDLCSCCPNLQIAQHHIRAGSALCRLVRYIRHLTTTSSVKILLR